GIGLRQEHDIADSRKVDRSAQARDAAADDDEIRATSQTENIVVGAGRVAERQAGWSGLKVAPWHEATAVRQSSTTTEGFGRPVPRLDAGAEAPDAPSSGTTPGLKPRTLRPPA